MADGVRAPKLERSGVTVRDVVFCCGRRTLLIELGGYEGVVGDGVDHAKEGGLGCADA